MSSKSGKGSKSRDRHKPRHLVPIPPDLYERLKERAAADDRSVSAYLRRLLARVLTNGEQAEAE